MSFHGIAPILSARQRPPLMRVAMPEVSTRIEKARVSDSAVKATENAPANTATIQGFSGKWPMTTVGASKPSATAYRQTAVAITPPVAVTSDGNRGS